MDDLYALIIVDVQPTFCEGGELAVEGGNDVAERIADYVTDNGYHYDMVVTTQDWHIDPGSHFSSSPDFVDTWPPHAIAGTPEAELHDAIYSLEIDAEVKKGEYSAAYSGFEGLDDDGRTLEDILREAGITAVDVVGIAESHCVKETALDALRRGWPVRVFSDLTVPVSEELGVEAREEMDEAGIVQIPSSEAWKYDDVDDIPDDGFNEPSRSADEDADGGFSGGAGVAGAESASRASGPTRLGAQRKPFREDPPTRNAEDLFPTGGSFDAGGSLAAGAAGFAMGAATGGALSSMFGALFGKDDDDDLENAREEAMDDYDFSDFDDLDDFDFDEDVDFSDDLDEDW